MRVMLVPKLVNIALSFCKKYGMDESHAVGHGMNVLHLSRNIMHVEVERYPILSKQRDIIYTSAMLHDVCDHKYVDEKAVWNEVKEVLKEQKILSEPEIDICTEIVQTMSYSKVKENGFPDMGEYQMAYHVVREADLLAAYDVDRALLYDLYRTNDFRESIGKAETILNNRVYKHMKDGLLVTDYSKKMHNTLVQRCKYRYKDWCNLMDL